VIVDLVGFGIVMPILPFYALEFGANATVLGLLMMGFAAAQFVFAPLWGRLSDRVGRRPVLLATIAGTALSLIALERRGIALRIHNERRDPATGKLPVYHAIVDNREEWFVTREALDKFVAAEEAKAGGKLNVDSGGVGKSIVGAAASAAPGANGDSTHAAETARLRIVELHEVRSINAQLAELAQLGFDIQSLIPQERTGSEDARYTLRREEHTSPLEDLRQAELDRRGQRVGAVGGLRALHRGRERRHDLGRAARHVVARKVDRHCHDGFRATGVGGNGWIG